MYYVYILTNKYNKTLYVGVTNDVERRQREHEFAVHNGFTKTYNVNKLVYYETYADIKNAIAREKQLKGWRRDKKDALIFAQNPNWNDLTSEW